MGVEQVVKHLQLAGEDILLNYLSLKKAVNSL
jgi:hypothetical protein